MENWRHPACPHLLGETRLPELLYGILAAKQPWKVSACSLLLVS